MQPHSGFLLQIFMEHDTMYLSKINKTLPEFESRYNIFADNGQVWDQEVWNGMRKILSLMLAAVILFGGIPITGAAQTFSDVPESSWYASAVQFVHSGGLMNGTGTDRFSPDVNMSRAMVVTVLHRLQGSPESYEEIPFWDVSASQYYYEPVQWSYEYGIVNGTSWNTFSPDANVTREQLVTIFYRFAQALGYDVGASADLSSYWDAYTVSGYAVSAFSWAAAVGIINGVSTNALGPQGNATRAQCAAILQRFITWTRSCNLRACQVAPMQNYSSRAVGADVLQDIRFWAGDDVEVEDLPKVKNGEGFCKYNIFDDDLIFDYARLLMDCGFELAETNEYKGRYFYGFTSPELTSAPSVSLARLKELHHVTLNTTSFGEICMHYTDELEVVDLGLRRGSGAADTGPAGKTVEAGLLRLGDGAYQTSDGRLYAARGTAVVLRDGVAVTVPAQGKYHDGCQQIWVQDYASGEGLFYEVKKDTSATGDIFSYGELEQDSSNVTVSQENLLKYGWDYPLFAVCLNNRWNVPSVWDGTAVTNATVRVMYYQPGGDAVYYLYAELEGEPSTVEALCVVDTAQFAKPQTDNNNQNGSGNSGSNSNDDEPFVPDASRQECLSCNGTGKCSKCHGDGYLWSSAADDENRNCYKCNASGDCFSCSGTGFR